MAKWLKKCTQKRHGAHYFSQFENTVAENIPGIVKSIRIMAMKPNSS